MRIVNYREESVQIINLDEVPLLYKGEKPAILTGRVNQSASLRSACLSVGAAVFYSPALCQKRATRVCSLRGKCGKCSHREEGMYLCAYIVLTSPFVRWEEAEFI